MSESDMSNATPDARKIMSSWLHWLYGEEFAGNIWIGGHLNWRGARFTDVESAVTYGLIMDGQGANHPGPAGVYHRLTTMNSTAEKRGADEDSVMLPAVMLDLDLAGPGHKAMNLPVDEDDLRAVLADAGLPEPSAWVNSGGGRYPVWKLADPVPLDAAGRAGGFEQAREAVRAIQRAVREAAAARGWKLDNTSDLARVYRLPGTTNRKGERPVVATWAPGGGRTYHLAELIPAVGAGVPAAVPVAPVAAPPDDEASWGGGLAGLFGGGAGGGGTLPGARGFTVGEAMAFVAPKLAALRAARDGEINVRLNEAACAMAHFGPEFWDEAAADGQLHAALAATAYDGATWKAEDTIASARRGMSGDWRAVLVPGSGAGAGAGGAPELAALEQAVVAAPGDAVDALLAEMLSLDQLESAPPPKFLIHKFLQFDSESWIIGAPGSKKSFVAFDMAARVVRGEPWQGFRTNPADVVFIVAEGASGHGKRVKAWRLKYGAVERDGEQCVFTLPRPVQAKDVASWAVLVGACRVLADRARQRGRGLMVVVDTQARVTVGLKENDNGEMNYYVEAVSAIRRATGAAVVTIHHTKKGGGDARGASVIDGAQTTELKVVSDSGKLTGKVITEKQKDIDEHKPLNIAFEIVNVGVDQDGEPLTSLVLAEQDSASFRAAWSGAEADTAGQGEPEAPFVVRETCEPWIMARRPRTGQAPVNEWWLIQVLVDTARTTGLTQSEVQAIAEEKRGKIDKTTFKRAWQKVTDEAGQWADVVTNVGGQRWSVDPLAVEAARSEHQG